MASKPLFHLKRYLYLLGVSDSYVRANFSFYTHPYGNNKKHFQEKNEYFCVCIGLCLNVYLFLRERERGRQSVSRGGAERGRPRIRSRLQALSCQPRARHRARTHEPWDHDGRSTDWATQAPLFSVFKSLLWFGSLPLFFFSFPSPMGFCQVSQDPHKSETIWYLSFSVWLISLSITLSSSIHVATKGHISFFLIAT